MARSAHSGRFAVGIMQLTNGLFCSSAKAKAPFLLVSLSDDPNRFFLQLSPELLYHKIPENTSNQSEILSRWLIRRDCDFKDMAPLNHEQNGRVDYSDIEGRSKLRRVVVK